jgi:small conductance mechanosensitive channel
MDIYTIIDMVDPQTLRRELQSSVDSLAGRHINMTSVEVLLDTIDSIDIVNITANIIIIFIILFITFTAVRIVDRMLRNYIPKVAGRVDVKMDETVQVMIRRLASATIYIIGLMLVIFQIPQLHNLATALLAGAGIAGLAIGFAAKDSLSNFTSGIFIAVFQPFRVGDLVDFKGDYGQVEDLTLRHTVIRTWDNRRIIVPNSTMSTDSIINWSIREPDIIWTVDFKIKEFSDLDRARGIIIHEARRHPLVMSNRDIKVLLTDMKKEELNLRLEVHLPGRNVATGVDCDIREAVGRKFHQEGIAPIAAT